MSNSCIAEPCEPPASDWSDQGPPKPPGSPFRGPGGLAQDTVLRSRSGPLSSPPFGRYISRPAKCLHPATQGKPMQIPCLSDRLCKGTGATYLLIRPNEE